MQEENQELKHRLRSHSKVSRANQEAFTKKFSGKDLKDLLRESDGNRSDEEDTSPYAVPSEPTPRNRHSEIEPPRRILSSLPGDSDFDDEDEMASMQARFQWTNDSRRTLRKSHAKILMMIVFFIALIDGRPYQALTEYALDLMTHGQVAQSPVHEKSKPISYAEAVRQSPPRQSWQQTGLPAQQASSVPAQSWPVIGDYQAEALEQSPIESIQKTTLRSEPPEGRFTRGRVTTLVSVKARVRNVGSVPARNIRVASRLPSGVRIAMKGPSELQAGETAIYSADPNQIVTVAGNLQMEQTCENCRK
jgi:hypothetical protein